MLHHIFIIVIDIIISLVSVIIIFLQATDYINLL